MSISEKLTQIAENEQRVFEAGRKAEHNEFWDAFQQNGKRTSYVGSFNMGWTAETFRPKYNLIARSAYCMFNRFSYNVPINLKQLLIDAGVTLTFPNCSNFSSLFQVSGITHLGEIDFSGATKLDCTNVFSDCYYLEAVDKVILPVGQTTFSSWFYGCRELKNITIVGVIEVNFSFKQSTKLSKASIENTISCLSDTASGQTLTLSKTAVNNAFTDAEWTALADTKKNWTISLV